ncbi:hypothetical protein [Armatimonas sp.]|uniref:hypothetical protein n=1 Tax=Armatimonas sp. TaxID=1872638 RepID=UPI0037525A94
MQTPLELAWREWEAFCEDIPRRAGEAFESAARGLPSPPRDHHVLRDALFALDSEQLTVFLDDPRLAEAHPEPGLPLDSASRFALLLCFLPPHAALALAQRYDDPCRAKSNLPPRPRLVLFLTFRWKAFLLENLHREMSVLSLLAHRFHFAHFVNRFGDEATKALLTTNDPPALARELVKAQKHLPDRTKP